MLSEAKHLRSTILVCFLLFCRFSVCAQCPELSVPGHHLYVDKIQYAHARFPQIKGNGIVVSVKEKEFDSRDVDLKNRVLPFAPHLKDPTSHSSIVATLIAGAGNTTVQGLGVAPGCFITSSGYSSAFGPDPDEYYTGAGIAVQNHSYGHDIDNSYAESARRFDESARRLPGTLHVFSAGNSGATGAPNGRYQGLSGFANLTGGFKQGVNILTVGAIDSFGRLQPFSAHGPAYDGRIKPDLCAYGHDGTSESAALVSGAAACLQQAFHKEFGTGADSDGLRALLLTTAVDNGSPGPDYFEGWGGLDLHRALKAVSEKRIILKKLTPGDSAVLTLALPENIHTFRVGVAWIDHRNPAKSYADKALDQDIDLQLFSPDGELFLPWTLHPHPHPDSLQLPARRGVDTLNNFERTDIFTPLSGLWKILIDGKKLDRETVFSVVFDRDTIDRFEWIFPGRHSPIIAGKDNILQWDTNIKTDQGILEWKPLETPEWRLIDSNITTSNTFHRFRAPYINAPVQMRFRTASAAFLTDTFMIAAEPRVETAYHCPDSVLLYWHPPAPGLTYEVFGLGEFALETLFKTQDTLLYLSKSEYPQQRFAVAVSGINRFSGPRSGAPDIGLQGVGCFPGSLFGQLNADGVPQLRLTVSEAIAPDSVALFRLDGTKTTPLISVKTSERYFEAEDDAAFPGIRRYRAFIRDVRGARFWSDTLRLDIPGEDGIWVFPNPAHEVLRVICNIIGEKEFLIYNAVGTLVHRQILEELNSQILLGHRPPGGYFWEIRVDGKQVKTGKIVKL